MISRARGIARELHLARSVVGDPDFYTDLFAYRALRLPPFRGLHDKRRTITTRDGSSISYRRNRGDIQSIREVYLERCYRLPPVAAPRTLLDLGSNIGLTSLWYAKTYGLERVVAVEPVPENAALVRANLSENAVPFEMMEAAVGPVAGSATFAVATSSNLGHLGEGSLEVRVTTVPELLNLFDGPVDILKLDIEGGEQQLLTADDVSWLDQVRIVIAEFHPEVVEYDQLVSIVSSRGFAYLPTGQLWPGSMDIFLRPTTL